MKTVFLTSVLALTSLTSFAASHLLANFDELQQALDAGKRVRVVIHYEKCKKTSGDDFVTLLSGGFNMDVFNHYQMPLETGKTAETIVTSQTVFSLSQFLGLGAVNNYIRVAFFKDNNAYVSASILDAQTNENKISNSWSCPLSVDQENAGISLYSSK